MTARTLLAVAGSALLVAGLVVDALVLDGVESLDPERRGVLLGVVGGLILVRAAWCEPAPPRPAAAR